MIKIAVLLMCLLGATAFAKETSARKVADVGDGKVLICKKGNVKLEISKSADPANLQGFLTVGKNHPTVFDCKDLNEKPASYNKLYDCDENGGGMDGRFSALVDTGGATNEIQAVVSRGQVFPYKPKVFYTLPCKAVGN